MHIRVLLLSDKNAPAARDHLLEVCETVGIVADESNAAVLVDEGFFQQPVPLIALSELQNPEFQVQEGLTGFHTNDEWVLQAMIIHSSGSTGLPKPIIHTNRSLCLIARMYRLFPDFVVENWYLCFPLFHIAGVSIALSGLPNGLPTTLPPVNWPPAPSAILSAFQTLCTLGHPADCLHCAPSVIEDLYTYISATTQDFTPLTSLKILQPGGAPLSSSLLAKLTALGANVKTTYGSTEIGPPFRTIPHTKENPNCYHVRNLYPESPLVQMEPLGEGLFECVVYRGFELAAELWLADDAPNPYRTNDLFIEDPPGSGTFVLQGRKDDILVHDNGEKTHAGALQMSLEESDPVIVKAVVFGSGKPCTAAVIEVTGETWTLGPGVAEERIWQAATKCNDTVARHSQIDRAMLLILGNGQSLPVTPKGNVRRKEAWKMYGDRIEMLYDRLLGDVATRNDDGNEDAYDDLPDLDFIRAISADVCQKQWACVEAETSFYDLGLDSQRAVKFRSRLIKRFEAFPLMFIFEHPTAERLHGFLTKPKTRDEALNSDERRLIWIRNTIKNYERVIDQWKTSRPPLAEPAKTDGETVYLTGASGALGNALLENLVQSSRVEKIYCGVRGQNPQERIQNSLRKRGYAKDIYSSSKICAVPYDMTQERLGLAPEAYELMLCEVTVVIHNAWKMDFNQRVEMFEADCLRGTMNLLSFCCSGRKKTFSLMSSVAACMGQKAKGHIIQEAPVKNDPLMALNTGYAQSKFIVEKITQHYSSAFSTPVKLFRVGQLCGHSQLGVWNSTEMWPIMISTGLRHIHALPMLPYTTVNWLPVDLCASSICSALFSAGPEQRTIAPAFTVHNLVNPFTITWLNFLSILAVAASANFETITMPAWVGLLEKAAEDGREDIPGLKLLGFFQEMADGVDPGEAATGKNGEGVEFATESVQGAEAVNVETVKSWLVRWREESFL